MTFTVNKPWVDWIEMPRVFKLLIMSVKLQPENWVDRYEKYLTTYTRKRISDPSTVQDIVQETFLCGYKSRELFKGIASEKTWLTAILKNKIVDHYRQANTLKGKGLQKTVSFSALDSEPHLEPTEDSYENNPVNRYIHFKELEQILNEGLKSLKGVELKVYHLQSKGFDNDYICDRLSISKSHCWVALHRARQKLKAHLNNAWDLAS